jgi:hypothetical protein
MRRFLMAAVFTALCTSPAGALSEMQALVQYDCQAQACTAQCTGPQTNFSVAYQTLTVFQWKDHVRRIWIAANAEQYLLGDDTTCKFEGRPTFQFNTSPLGPPPAPQCVCIGAQCNPPGCRR